MKIFIKRTEIYDLVRLPVLLSILLSATFILGVIAIPNAEAAVDMFLKIDDVQGESRDSVHKGDIDVLSWSWGMSSSGSMHVGGGGGAGKVSVEDLSFTKYIDKSSPILLLYAANGDHFNEAKLVVRKAGKAPLEYFTLTFTNVLVSSVSMGGSGGEDRLTENITLNFEKVEWKYIEQKDDGSGGPDIEGGWDISANTET